VGNNFQRTFWGCMFSNVLMSSWRAVSGRKLFKMCCIISSVHLQRVYFHSHWTVVCRNSRIKKVVCMLILNLDTYVIHIQPHRSPTEEDIGAVTHKWYVSKCDKNKRKTEK